MADPKTEAVQRQLTEREILLGLEPEAFEAQQAIKDRLGRRRAALARVSARPGEIPKIPLVTEAEQAATADSARIIELQSKKNEVLKAIAEYRKENNPMKRMELARKITKDHRDAKRAVGVARIGAQGGLLEQKWRSRDKISDRMDELSAQYGMMGAQPRTWKALGQLRKTISRAEQAEVSLDNNSLMQATLEALQSVDDPAEKQRLLVGIDRELMVKGLPPATSTIEMAAAQREAGALPKENMVLNDLVDETLGFAEGQAQIAAQFNQLGLERQQLTQELEAEERKLGASVGAADDVIDIYRTITMEMGGKDGDADEKAMEPFMGQIDQLDDMIRSLERPTFTDAYQRSRAQILAHPMFDDYMRIRNFAPGQEDLALNQLVKEAGPAIKRKAAIGRMTRRVDPDDPRTAIGKITSKLPLLGKIPMGERRKEALRVKAAATPAADPEARAKALEEAGVTGESERETQQRVREEAGIAPGKTIFQEAGITPAVGQTAQEQFDRADIAAKKSKKAEEASKEPAAIKTDSGGKEPTEEELAQAGLSAGLEQMGKSFSALSADLVGNIPAIDGASPVPEDSGQRDKRKAAIQQMFA